jgi:hypothetical protein
MKKMQWLFITVRNICLLMILFSLIPHLLLSATFTVVNIADAGPGSLRAAITAAEQSQTTSDTINFNIPGPGPFIIRPLSQLPQITDTLGLFINGLSQPNASAGANPPATANLLVELRGTNAGSSHGLWILARHTTIQGLVIDSFGQDGIRIQGISTGAYNNVAYCNFVGMDRNGVNTMGNGWVQPGLWAGIEIVVPPGGVTFAYNNRVSKNLVSGNHIEGVGISSCPPGDCYFNLVDTNYIGTDITRTLDRGNGHDGVYIGEGAHDNLVTGNIISGNDFEGVCIVGFAEAVPPVNTHHNTIQNNIIGLSINLNPLGNLTGGVSIGKYGLQYQGGYASDNVVVNNQIAHNTRNGIMVWEHQSSTTNADGNRFSQNSIYNNSSLGIDLGDNGVTSNDAGDLDNGANQELNFPVITSAQFSSSGATITGTIDIGQNPTTAIIELFKAQPDPTGYGEGRNYVGFTIPNTNGNWNLTVPGVAVGDTITAATIDALGNTSEFSQNRIVIAGIEEDILNQTLSSVNIVLYPNPAKSYFTIRASQVADGTMLKIFNVSGNIVKETRYSRYDSRIMLDRIKPGIYFVTLGNKIVKDKLIITR